MNWGLFGIGVGAIAFVAWIIIAGRKECKNMGWKNNEKKLF